MKGADNALRAKLSGIVHRMVVVSRKMTPGGKTPWWQQVPDSADEMTYECDAKLGAPAAVDCAKVEYGELGADDDTISVGAGVVKFLSSGWCSRQVDDLRARFLTDVCQVHVKSLSRQQPPSHSTGAKYAQLSIPSLTPASTLRISQAPEARLTSDLNPWSAAGLAGESDRMMMIFLVSKDSVLEWYEMRKLIATGLNALPPGGNITVSSISLRPPERMLGVNSTLAENSTMLVNSSYAVPAL